MKKVMATLLFCAFVMSFVASLMISNAQAVSYERCFESCDSEVGYIEVCCILYQRRVIVGYECYYDYDRPC